MNKDFYIKYIKERREIYEISYEVWIMRNRYLFSTCKSKFFSKKFNNIEIIFIKFILINSKESYDINQNYRKVIESDVVNSMY